MNLSTSQRVWAGAGLAILLITLLVAFSNLRDIYNAQQDFVVGSLLSLSGFCFGRALSRTQEQKAIELIRTAPTPAVNHALREAMATQLHSAGAFEQLSRLERNIDAALDRLSEYYDSQCQRLDFYRHSSLLRVALDDLDKTAANVVGLRQILHESASEADHLISPAARLALISVRRDLREAMNRRDQAYEWFETRLDRKTDEEAWDVFAVMTSDILKGTRSLEALLSQHVSYPHEEYLPTIRGYLAAAIGRGKEFTEAVEHGEVAIPKIFEVMMYDLTRALDAIDHVDLAGRDAVRSPQ